MPSGHSTLMSVPATKSSCCGVACELTPSGAAAQEGTCPHQRGEDAAGAEQDCSGTMSVLGDALVPSGC